MRDPRKPRRAPERGSVLIIALLVLVAISFIAVTLAREAKVEMQVAARTVDNMRARAIADSAIDRAMAAIKLDDTPGDTLTDTWRDDEPDFRNIQCGSGHYWILFGEEDPTVYGPGTGMTQGAASAIKFGVRDEASKLNLNTATLAQLEQLPGMTEDIAESIIDWRSAGETASPLGAKSAYYNSLTPGYSCKDAPFESMEELLCVKEIDESVLYGEDRNRNGILDPCEDDGDKSFPPDDSDGQLLLGLADYLTLYSMEYNWTNDQRTRLYLGNVKQLSEISTRLTTYGVNQQIANAVAQYIVRPPRGAPPFSSIGQLVNVQGMDATNMAIVGDELTTVNATTIPGLINVNTAAQEVLAGLPGLTANDVQAIMAARTGSADLTSPAWLMAVLTKPKLAAIWDLITTRSFQFTIHVAVALDDHPSIIRRCEVVVDRGYAPMKVMYRRDLTPLGFPLPNERGTGPGSPP
jgi:type II secretory pathway component PulK